MNDNIFLIKAESAENEVYIANGLESYQSIEPCEDFSDSFQIQVIQSNEDQIDTNGLNCYENDGVLIQPRDSSFMEEHNETNVFVHYLENGKVILKSVPNFYNGESLNNVDCETYVTEIDYEGSDKSIPLVEEQIDSDEIVAEPPPLYSALVREPRLPSAQFKHLVVSEVKTIDKEVFRSLPCESSNPDYAKDRYLLYSTSKSKLKPRKPCSPKMIPPKVFKNQLTDTSDIVSPLSIIASYKKLSRTLASSAAKCFFKPSREMSSVISSKFSRNCGTSHEPDEIDVDELGLLPVGFQIPIDRSKVKRITRKRKIPMYTNGSNVHLSNKPAAADTVGVSAHQVLSSDEPEGGQVEVYMTSQEECFLYSGNMDEEEQQIIVIQDDLEKAGHIKNNIEVLLEAAAGEQTSQEIYFCHNSMESEIVINTDYDHPEISDTYNDEYVNNLPEQRITTRHMILQDTTF